MMNVYSPGVRAAMRFGTGRAAFDGMPLPTFGQGASYGRSYGNRTSEKPKKKATADKPGHASDADGYTFRIKWPDYAGNYRISANDLTIGTCEILVTRPLTGHGAPADATPLEPGSPISMRPLDFKFSGVRVVRVYGGATLICVDFVVPDRKTGTPLSLTYSHAVLSSAEKHYMAEQTGIAIAKAFEHEVREMLYLGAKPFIDPHPEVS